MSRNKIFILLSIIILLGLALRFAEPGGRYLWQDEAETVINSLQVMEDGYPHGVFKGKPLFENASFISSDDPKYAYESTNYYGTKFERNKGWLTYYYQALFLRTFGFSTFSARLPFVLLFAFSAVLLYLLAKKLFSYQVGLIALFLYAINVVSVHYESQARYYTLVVLLTLICLYVFYQALTIRSWKWYVFSSLALVFLFYTHVAAAFTMCLFFIISHIYFNKRLAAIWNPKVILTLVVSISIFIPWAVLVKFWIAGQLFPQSTVKLLWIVVFLIVFTAYGYVKWLFFRKIPHFVPLFSPLNYIISFVLIAAVIEPLLIPLDSLYSRIFISIYPILCLLGAYYFYSMVKKNQWRLLVKKYSLPLISVIFSFLLLGYVAREEPAFYKTEWVQASIDYLDSQNVTKDTPIFVSYQHFPFMVYSDYNVDLVWPIRKSYIDEYQGTMYFIVDERALFPQIFYREKLPPYDNLNYYEKIQSCTKILLLKQVYIYEC